MPPKPDRYFNDYAGVVDRALASELNEQLAQFERDTSTQIVVAIYRTMQSESSVADYTQRIAQTWGVGQKGRNNGAVLFVFVENRQMFIQTGYGVEGALPDATCSTSPTTLSRRSLRKATTRRIKGGVTAMMQAVRGEYKGTGRYPPGRGKRKRQRISGWAHHSFAHRDLPHHVEPPPQGEARLWLRRLGRTLYRRIWRKRRGLVRRRQLGRGRRFQWVQRWRRQFWRWRRRLKLVVLCAQRNFSANWTTIVSLGRLPPRKRPLRARSAFSFSAVMWPTVPMRATNSSDLA